MAWLTSVLFILGFVQIYISLPLHSPVLSNGVMAVGEKKTTYTYVPGFFVQDNLTATGIPAVPPRFGLLDESTHRWPKLFEAVKRLNDHAGRGTSYKVFFFGRHGEGYHNVGEAKYGTPAWNDYWSKLDGDGTIVWGPDAELTDLGKTQAQAARNAWKTELASSLPLPGRLYCSPLTRALQTYNITFDGIIPKHHSRPEVVENCREMIGVHTCDKRRTKSYIETTFSVFDIEDGFAEEDPLWTADVREIDAHVTERAHSVLDRIFEDDETLFISITAHSGSINGFVNATGRPRYSLATGGVLPMVVKGVQSY